MLEPNALQSSYNCYKVYKVMSFRRLTEATKVWGVTRTADPQTFSILPPACLAQGTGIHLAHKAHAYNADLHGVVCHVACRSRLCCFDIQHARPDAVSPRKVSSAGMRRTTDHFENLRERERGGGRERFRTFPELPWCVYQHVFNPIDAISSNLISERLGTHTHSMAVFPNASINTTPATAVKMPPKVRQCGGPFQTLLANSFVHCTEKTSSATRGRVTRPTSSRRWVLFFIQRTKVC